MVTAVELRTQRASLIEQSKEILGKAEAEGRSLNAEETVSFDKIHVAAEEIRGQYERVEKQAAAESELNESRGRIADANETKVVSADEAESRNVKEADAFRAWLIRGENGLTTEQRQIMSEKRAQSVGTTTAGGYTVPEGFAGKLEASMLAFGGMREIATVIKTASGNALPFPTANDTAQKGAILAENAQVATQDVTFGVVQLDAYKYSSKLVLVSIELLQDSGIDIESTIAGMLGERLARIHNDHFTTGTGSSQPNGAMTAAGTGVTAASASAITADELIDLFHSVDPAYRGNAKWMLNDATVKVIRKLKDADNQYIWQPGLQVGVADSLLGKPVSVNQSVATIATTAKVIGFGDFSKYLVRDVIGTQVVQLRERYADYHQVGFLAFNRADGDMLDAGTDPVKVLVMA